MLRLGLCCTFLEAPIKLRTTTARHVSGLDHHRCNPDGLTIEAATERAAATWKGREPWAHLSSPCMRWTAEGDHRPHADYIDPADVPEFWRTRTMTVDVEAKAKELAVLRLARWLRGEKEPLATSAKAPAKASAKAAGKAASAKAAPAKAAPAKAASAKASAATHTKTRARA